MYRATRLNGFLGHNGEMRTDVVAQQNNAMLPIKTFLMKSRLESFHPLNIEFRLKRLVPFMPFVMDNPFPVPPYAHYSTQMKIFLRAVSLVHRG